MWDFKMVEINLKVVKTLVLESHLRDRNCLQMYALVAMNQMVCIYGLTVDGSNCKTITTVYMCYSINGAVSPSSLKICCISVFFQGT